MSFEYFDKFLDAVESDLTTAEILLKGNNHYIHATNSIGETVFHFLAVENQRDKIEWLIEKGANINTTNDFGNTALAEAASLGYLELCTFLLSKGADPKILTPDGDSALSDAAVNDRVAIVNLLLNYVMPSEKISNYFSEITYDVLLDKESESAIVLHSRWPKFSD